MLTLRIEKPIDLASWSWQINRWASGASFVEPYDHQALENWAARGTDGVALMVRERLPNELSTSCATLRPMDAGSYDAAVADAKNWPGGFILIELTASRLLITTGDRATAPIFLNADDHVLHGSWNMADLRPLLHSDKIDIVEATRRLSLQLRYTPRTVFDGVYMLTERATAHYDGAISLEFPKACMYAEPRELPDEAPVVDAYEQLIKAAVLDSFYEPERSAVELSGGMDSANVGMSLAALHGHGIASGSLIQGGRAGEQQIRRRVEMIKYAGFDDYTLLAEDYLPLDPGRVMIPLAPHEEIYIGGHCALLRHWRARGVLYAFTGVGGDEMLSVGGGGGDPTPVPEWLGTCARQALHQVDEHVVPTPPISDSTLMSIACGAPMYLRAGIWPVYPLADPALFRFGQWLPTAWRQDKKLARGRLESLGFSHEVAHPLLKENFRGALVQSLVRFGPGLITDMLDDGSALIEAGLVAADSLRCVQARLEHGFVDPGTMKIVHTLTLDKSIKMLS